MTPDVLPVVLAHVHEGAAIAGSAPAVVALLGAALVVATMLSAAVLLAPFAVGAPSAGSRGRLLAVRVCVVIACAAALATLQGAGGGPAPGEAETVGLVMIAGSLGLSSWFDRGEPAAALVALVGLVLAGHPDEDGAFAGSVMGIHLVAGAVWIGAVLQLGLWTSRDAVAMRRAIATAGPALGIAAVAVAATGMWNSRVHVEAARLLATTAYGRLLVLKVLLVVLAVGLALWARRRSPRRVNLLGEGAVLACVAVLGATLAVLPGVLPFPAPVGPLVASASVDGHAVTVVLTPNQPGRNQLTIFGPTDAPAAWVDGDSLGAIALGAGAGATWTGTVDLVAGSSVLHVASLVVPIAVRHTPSAAMHLVERIAPSSADAPECSSRVLGQLAAIRDHNATSARTATLSLLAPDEHAPAGAIELPGCGEDGGAAKSGEILATALARRGVHALTVVVDGGDRAREFAEAVARVDGDVRVVGPVLDGTPLGDAVLVATGWADAPAVLDRLRVAGGAATRPVVLAPWLLHTELLAPAASDASLGQLTVAASIDPTSSLARRYLSGIAPGQEPSAAGLAGYAEALAAIDGDVPSNQPTTLALFTPVRIQVLPGHDHGPTSGWLPTGDLAPVSAVLR